LLTFDYFNNLSFEMYNLNVSFNLAYKLKIYKTSARKNKKMYTINHKNNQLNYYLAGLIESDGSIIVPKLNSNNKPTISIVFNIKDLPLAIKIKNVLGYGSIQKISDKNAVNLVIRNKKGIINLITLINGKLRTPKIFKFHDLID
jgi:hypothetical protein